MTRRLLALAAASVVLPPVMYAITHDSLVRAWLGWREGGPVMGVLALLGVLVPAALAGLGVRAARGKRTPPALVVIVACVPLATTLVDGIIAQYDLRREIALDGSTSALTAIEIASAKALSVDSFGALVGCCSALLGASVLAGSALSTSSAARDRSRAWAIGAYAGATVWLVAVAVLAAVRSEHLGAIALCPFIAVTGVALAIVVARDSVTLGATELLAAALALLGLCALEHALDATMTSRVLRAELADPAAIHFGRQFVDRLVTARATVPAGYAVHALIGGATLSMAIVAALHRGGRLRRGLAASNAAGVVVVALIAVGALGLTRQRQRATTEDDGLASVSLQFPYASTTPLDRSARCLANGDVPLSRLRAICPGASSEIDLIVRRERLSWHSNAGPFGLLLVPPHARISIRLYDSERTTPANADPHATLSVVSLPGALAIDGQRATLPLSPRRTYTARRRRVARYTLRRVDTVSWLARVVDAVTVAHGWELQHDAKPTVVVLE